MKKAGYKPKTVTVTSEMHGGGTAGAAGNVIAGGIVGIFVDAGNGSLNDLRPNPLTVTLEADGESAPPADTAAAPASAPDGAPVAPAPTEAAKQ